MGRDESANLESRISNVLWTFGHSNQPIEQFLAVLARYNIQLVIDVRRFPGSRKWPQFGAARLAASLAASGIGYAGLPQLGGRRRPRPDSPHTAWRVEAFRGYADFMDTPVFADGLSRIEALAREKRSAVMCAEALPWRCHRSLIADALIVAGWRVFDILSEKQMRPHALPEFARVDGQRVVYDQT